MTRRLLIDAGNTRLKWRCMDATGEVSRGAIRYAQHAKRWANELPQLEADSIWVGSVAGTSINTELIGWARTLGLPAPKFVEVQREALGLHVAYRRLSRLGVDRYLAMLGARAATDGALCVVDIGTAMTLDAVDDHGHHQGGLIAPGPRTMMHSLLTGTANIGAASDKTPDSPFARDTAEAVTGGACFASAALIDRFARATSSLLELPVTLMLTGGDVGRVRPLLETESSARPNLVFDGLLALALRREPGTTTPLSAQQDDELP